MYPNNRSTRPNTNQNILSTHWYTQQYSSTNKRNRSPLMPNRNSHLNS
ncbi:hypothetical protein pEaSNUABM43_00177 [Erwinia phage pEa_SNUABM_43]|nr:hypothetical protein pSALSNUABM04_165 [Salmonella phage pSal-SNUABM-04]QQO90661.1 hypothetical protein pEaSNUABM43_00177 [Erwinia phage pEa_SNUABM_43]